MIDWLQPRAQRYRFLPEGRLGGSALPWIIGMMTFLAALALAGGIALSTATASLTTNLSQGFTVQILEPNPEAKRRQADAVVKLLRARSDITDVRAVGDAEIQALLEPWLGAGVAADELPLPAMIDAAFKPGASDDSAAIAAAVRLAAPSARIDDHASWFAPLAGIVDVLRWLAIAIGVLVTAATIAIVVLSVRSAIGTFGPTIETLHMMGAEDRTIAALFQYRYAIHGLTGGTIGFGGALVVVIMIGQLLAGFGGGIAGTISIPFAGWAALFALPLLVALLTRVTARLTVDRALKLHL